MNKSLIHIAILLLPFLSFAQSFVPYATFGEKIDACGNTHQHRNLKQIEVNPLMQDYDINYIKLDIETENSSDYIEGIAFIKAIVTADLMNSFCISLSSNMNIESVQFNGAVTDFMHTDDELIVELDVPVHSGETILVTVVYKGSGHDEVDYAGGLHFVEDQGNFNYQPLTYSFTQPFGADLWFPCKQDLTDKIDSLDIYITTPSSFKVSANGILKDAVELGNNKIRYEWETRYPTAYYLVAFNVFDYVEYNFYTQPENMDSPIFIQNFMVDQDHVDAMKEEIDKTSDAMNLYSTLLGHYPFKDEKYGHSIWGKGFGMEHQTITSMPYNIDFRRLSHELSHQWFGNSTTCATWQDIWLNEGFASYFDYLALKLLASDASGENRMLYYHNKAMTNPYGSVYVPDEYATDASRIFDYKMSYCKGAAVVKMLRFEFQDDELFWEILHNYLAEFKNSSATTNQFRTVVEETSGRDFGYFFEQWIYGEGYPKYQGLWYQKNDSLFIKVSQFASFPSKTPFFKMLMQYKIKYEGGDTLLLFTQEQGHQKFNFPFAHKVKSIEIDPFNEVLNEDKGIKELDVSGVEKHLILECLVYPNPFSNKIRIDLNEEQKMPTSIQIFDVSGRLVMQETTQHQSIILNSMGLKPSVYFIEIKNGSKYLKQTLIKQ